MEEREPKNEIASTPIRIVLKAEDFFLHFRKNTRPHVAYSNPSRLSTRKRKKNGGELRVAFLTGGAPYDLGLHRIPKAPFFVRPHENDMPAFLKNSKIRKRCLRVDGRLHGGGKKALFSKISLFV